MSTFHEFRSPRNLYEKLTRDNIRLSEELNGDNLFAFTSTIVHLQPWIKNSPLSSSERVRRLLRKASSHPYMKVCKDISAAKRFFKLELFENGCGLLHVGDEQIDVNDFRRELVELYDNFFKQK
ncbi:MAG: hypothetical protein L3J41_10605 [Melioribacteraceae bacterium]|nr:hypothetical protein [Melioribacteraceae bacterium]